MAAAMEKMKTGPSGILIATPDGANPLSPVQFVSQFGCDIGAMMVAAILMAYAFAPASYWKRVCFVAALGLIPSLGTEIPYLIWYRFPADYTAAQLVVQLGSFFAGGMVLAWRIRADALPRATRLAA